MAQVKVRTYTGPVQVALFADRMRSAGFQNVMEGTEHVYGELEISDLDFAWEAADRLYAQTHDRCPLVFQRWHG